MDVYHYSDYKAFIKKKIEENAHIRGYQGKLALAAGCGRSFLSQAINSHIQLTLDHGAGLCQFWEFDEERTDYFLDLMNLERAASQPLKTRIEARLKKLRADSQRLEKRRTLGESMTPGLKEAVYYSAWHLAAIHALTSIPRFQTVRAISQRLDLPSALVERSLRDLQLLGLVKLKGDRWIVDGASIHLPKESPLSLINQTNWRNQAMKHLGQYPNDGIHYSAIMTMSRSDAEKVLELLNRSIKEVLKIASPSEEEELVGLNIDYFSV